jgi:hypothetical protein
MSLEVTYTNDFSHSSFTSELSLNLSSNVLMLAVLSSRERFATQRRYVFNDP